MNSSPPERFKAAVEVDVSAGGRLNFQLNYMVAKAMETVVRLRLSDVDGGSAGNRFLPMTQLSGEDWRNFRCLQPPALAASCRN
jgi:hypothetical protein